MMILVTMLVKILKARMKRIHLFLPIIIIMGFFIQTCKTPCQSIEYSVVDEMINDAKARITEISIDDFKAMMDEEEMFVLVDVRTLEEHDAGYIPGSVLIPRGRVEFRIGNEDFWEPKLRSGPDVTRVWTR